MDTYAESKDPDDLKYMAFVTAGDHSREVCQRIIDEDHVEGLDDDQLNVWWTRALCYANLSGTFARWLGTQHNNIGSTRAKNTLYDNAVALRRTYDTWVDGLAKKAPHLEPDELQDAAFDAFTPKIKPDPKPVVAPAAKPKPKTDRKPAAPKAKSKSKSKVAPEPPKAKSKVAPEPPKAKAKSKEAAAKEAEDGTAMDTLE
eukprot:jgi/Tetstr1/421571/TSEL_012515.t1